MDKFRVNLKKKMDKYIKLNGISYEYFNRVDGFKSLYGVRKRGVTTFKTLFETSKFLNVDIRNFLMFDDYTYVFENSFDTFEEFLVFLGARFKSFRLSKNMRALDIANEINININTIFSMENARSTVSLNKFYIFLEVLKITPDRFFLENEKFSVKIKKTEYRNITVSNFYDRVFELQDIQNVIWNNTININFQSFPTIFTFLKICNNLKIYPKDFFDYNNQFLNKNYSVFDLEKTFSWIKNKTNVNIVNRTKYIKLDSVFYFCDEESIDISDFFDESTLVGNIDQFSTKIRV